MSKKKTLIIGSRASELALWQADKGLFTKEIEKALLMNKIDIAVHSLKDLQTEIPNGLKLAVVTKRHHVEDVLIARGKKTTINDLKEGAVVATGSLRRSSQLKYLRPDIKIIQLKIFKD
mgnify:CR=1 FL=1